jgi:hypothetical protein
LLILCASAAHAAADDKKSADAGDGKASAAKSDTKADAAEAEAQSPASDGADGIDDTVWPYGRPAVMLGVSGALVVRFSGNDDVVLRWAELGGVGGATVPQFGPAVDVSVVVRVFPWLSVGAIYHTLQQASISIGDGATGPELDFGADAIVNVARVAPLWFRNDTGYGEGYVDAGIGLGFMRDANEAFTPALTVGIGFDFVSTAIIGAGIYSRFWYMRFASVDDAGGATIQLQNRQDVAVDMTGIELLGLRLNFGY